MPVPCDPNFADVSLLLDCDGVNGSTVFTDLSNVGNIVTASGNAAVETAVVKFGTGALNLPDASTGPDTYISTPITAGGPLDFFSTSSVVGDFTIEGWFYIETTVSDLIITNWGTDLGGNGPGFYFLVSTIGGGSVNLQIVDISGATIEDNVSIAQGQWYHWALVRESGNVTLYLNGIAVNAIPANWGTAAPQAGARAIFGWSPYIGGGIDTGYLDEMRVTSGLARYTSNFTPPTQPFGLACVADTTVPDVVGDTVADATTAINAAILYVGGLTSTPSATVPVGQVISQSPTAGATVAQNSTVALTVSSGPASVAVPYVVGLDNTSAQNLIEQVGLAVGNITTVPSSTTPAGQVISQSPAAGTPLGLGGLVNLLESSGPPPVTTSGGFNVEETVISQYANSPVLLQLVENMASYIDQRANMEAFYSYIWNVDTAVGFGLDIWGRIVGVSRLLQIGTATDLFGFENSDVPPDWQPFNQGTFNQGNSDTEAYLLPDDAFRTLILTKALANICATTAPALNQLLRNLFPGRGRAYTSDHGDMSMSFVFEFSLTAVEYAILTQSGVLPHPAGVLYNVISRPGPTFGFTQEGPTAEPFGQGIFYLPP
jgi:Protein of unknown function (DUF2612)/PASTA domain/Concanavalin A-like lectin/glucanases superfamily